MAFLLAFVACLFVGNTVIQFSRCLPSAGSFYTYNTHGLGKLAGFLTGWLYWLAYAMLVPALFTSMGDFTRQYTGAMLGFDLPWWAISLATMAVVLVLSLRSMQASVQVSLTILAVQMAVFLVLAGLVIGRAGDRNSLSFFTPQASPTGWTGTGLGVVFGVLSFIGFDAAATLGEEMRQPRRNLPRAVLYTLVGIGLFYVLVMYALAAGYGLDNPANLEAFKNDPDPFRTLAQRDAPWLAHVVDLCAIASIFTCFLAIHNTTVRLVYTMGKERVLPRILGRVHPRWWSPYGAIFAQTLFTVVVGLALGFWLGTEPTGAYAFAGTIGTVAIILVYGLSNAALVRFFARRGQWHWFWHGLLPVLGIAALTYPLWSAVVDQDEQKYPSGLVPAVVGIWLLIGAGVYTYFHWAAPDRLSRLGLLLAEDEDLAKSASSS